MKTVFLRALKIEDKALALLGSARNAPKAHCAQRFDVDPSEFAKVPRSPFAYWVTDRMRCLFEEFLPFEASGRDLSIGASTKDDFRYVRIQHEVPPETIACSRTDTAERPWVPFAKGGAFSPFYADIQLLIHWLQDGASLKASIADYRGSRGWGFQWSAALNGHDRYFRSGITWPRRTQGGLSMRAMPAGCIFADKGPAAFVKNDDKSELLAVLATANSRPFKSLVDMQMAFGSYEVGVIQRTPLPLFNGQSIDQLAQLAHRGWSLKRFLDTCTETSHAFTFPALLQVVGIDVASRAVVWADRVSNVEKELAAIQAEIDERCFALYGIGETDRQAIVEELGNNATEVEPGDGADGSDGDAGEDADERGSTIDVTVLAAELVSWAVGVAFGRFDVRLATGALPLPDEPQPFDRLPVFSPGMLSNADGLPRGRPPVAYPLKLPETGVLVDDTGHAHDLTTAVRTVFDLVFGSNADRWLYDVAATLETTGHDLRTWLARDFFDFHLKRYSKSRRKAPIIWQLGTSSGRYSVWLYSHSLTRDSFFQIQNDIVGPKVALEERRLTSLIQNAGINASASERRGIDEQTGIVDELRGMLDEIKRVAPLWNPNLNDGVVLTVAPLWRLVPHKSWQRELKTKWGELVAGMYDWADIAMHLWPERVVPKCAADRSLAIAHGLEDVFWAESEDGKWNVKTPSRPVEEIVRERSSAAVKESLKGLLDAPIAAPTGRTYKRNGRPTAANGGRR